MLFSNDSVRHRGDVAWPISQASPSYRTKDKHPELRGARQAPLGFRSPHCCGPAWGNCWPRQTRLENNQLLLNLSPNEEKGEGKSREWVPSSRPGMLSCEVLTQDTQDTDAQTEASRAQAAEQAHGGAGLAINPSGAGAICPSSQSLPEGKGAWRRHDGWWEFPPGRIFLQ